MESDERDRQKEREELEDIRRKLMESGHPEVEAEMARVCSLLEKQFLRLFSHYFTSLCHLSLSFSHLKLLYSFSLN